MYAVSRKYLAGVPTLVRELSEDVGDTRLLTASIVCAAILTVTYFVFKSQVYSAVVESVSCALRYQSHIHKEPCLSRSTAASDWFSLDVASTWIFVRSAIQVVNFSVGNERQKAS